MAKAKKRKQSKKSKSDCKTALKPAAKSVAGTSSECLSKHLKTVAAHSSVTSASLPGGHLQNKKDIATGQPITREAKLKKGEQQDTETSARVALSVNFEASIQAGGQSEAPMCVEAGRLLEKAVSERSQGRRFVPERCLGSGGLCTVDAALDLLRLECCDAVPRVALKRLLPEYSQNAAARGLLAREFFALRHLAHPGVVRVFDLHLHGDSPALSMELLEGNNLHEELALNVSGLGVAAFPIISGLFEALAFLHTLGLAHGDIKPANIMLRGGKQPVLIDFNTVEAVALPGAASSNIGQSLYGELNMQAFSLLHASPELLEGAAPSCEADIYAASCTVYELISGCHPFKRLSACEAKEKALKAERLPNLNSRQWRLLEAGLSFNPALRPQAKILQQVFQNGGSLFKRLRNL